jgi:hypothetical protein
MKSKPVKKIEEVTLPKEGILKAAGSWKGIDTEAFKAYIADRRQSANRTYRGGDLSCRT